ncbi:Pentacotripeptide-repeat region of PRORP domain-containing protein [Plasmodiophora brassicae]|uniref:Pentacotripeptide-repeat region of PRORP domain-containing protein n=1 Tax=Plasmodiophora brassicae TaxID=37360 RepID=A0A0G4J8J1_PLABS|nr:hypothetical protein PBRA_009528 [Plasmodiophora brassicae]
MALSRSARVHALTRVRGVHHRARLVGPLDDFSRRPTRQLAAHLLRQDLDPHRGWAVFRRAVDSGLTCDRSFFCRALEYCRRRLPSKAPDVLREALCKGVDVDDDDRLFCLFLSSCKAAGAPVLRDTLDLYRRCGPRTHDVIVALGNLCRAWNAPGAALPLLSDALDNNVPISESLLSMMAACCAESRSALGAATAKRIVDDERVPLAYPQRGIYRDLCLALLSQGEFDAAMQALALMDQVGLPPTGHVYAAIIKALSSAGRLDRALDVFRQMVARRCPTPSPSLLATLITCSCAAPVRHHDNDDDQQYLDTLRAYVDQRSLLDVDPAVANAFIVAYGACGRVQDAELVFERVRSPRAGTFGALITAYARNDMLDAAIGTFRALERAGRRYTPPVLAAMLDVFARADRVDDAMDVFVEIRQRDVSVDRDAFVAFVAACGRRERLDAVRHLDAYARRRSLIHDGGVVVAFLAAYGACSQLPACQALFDRATRRPDRRPGHLPMFLTMIALYRKAGLLSRSIDTFERMLDASSTALAPGADVTATIFADLVETCTDAGDAERLGQLARKHGLDPRQRP